MKKILVTILLCGMLLSTVACAATPSASSASSEATIPTVDQTKFDNLKTDFDKLQGEYNTLKSNYDKLELELEKQTISSAEEIPISNSEGSLRASDAGIAIHDDENVTISFLGCEVGKYDDEEFVFYVINKTNVELTFQASAMAINGESLGSTSGSDKIAAQSKGKIRFTTEETFPTFTPDTLSGTIKVIDFGKSLFDRSYEANFTNLSVK